ncbi:MAG: alpha/beta hydrolase family protein, partial [Chitinophagaceae bacterium]
QTGEEKIFKNVTEYLFSKNGRKLLIEQAVDSKDSNGMPTVLLFDLQNQFADTLSRGGNEFKNFAMSDDGSQVAYVAERDAKPKDLQKYFKVLYFKEGMDSAFVLADRHSVGMKLGMTISEYNSLEFSKSGSRLFFGTAMIKAPKDTSLVDIDLVKLDIWHYNDDYLQTVQLSRLKKDLQQSFLTVYDLNNDKLEQLASEEIPNVIKTKDGDGDIFAGITDYGQRIESQWVGSTKKDIYAIRVNDGLKKLIKKGLQDVINPSYISPTGKYIMWYESKEKDYFVYDGKSTRNLTARLKVKLFDEDYDSPGEPSPYGVMGWSDGDSSVYIYDRYDIWEIDPGNSSEPRLMLSWKNNRKNKMAFRYIRQNKDENFLVNNQKLLFRTFNEKSKTTNYSIASFSDHINGRETISPFPDEPYNHSRIIKAKDRNIFIYTKESFKESPDLFVNRGLQEKTKTKDGFIYTYDINRVSNINQQQKDFNWGTAELFKWETFKGKNAEGILYKPQDFDPGKEYPLILYFYEKLSDSLHKYIPPAPTPSRLNIPFFVSRGYLVFAPDIAYTIGHPAQSAYDYVVSAARALGKFKWVDEKNIGIQGQSWGGIQVAQLITMTDMFKAAWAGAPVANMTSAYGGIRWESGANRQFQYEKTQSRIGATLWEKPELYIENSPLFHLPKVKTPFVIMANDADGAVPWYQGIELFTGLRRLGKKVWMLNYNGEAHNLVQRKNRKDIQVRQQQYFDWLLKGEKPATWIIDGVPAVKKGKDWGLELVD